jgi:hypothetical protein
MKNRPNILYALLAGLIAMLGVGLWQLLPAKEIEKEIGLAREVELLGRGGAADLVGPAPGDLAGSVPRLAAGIGFDSGHNSDNATSRRAAREAFLKKERMLMAQTWGFSDEQWEKFEHASVRNGRQERRAVFEQMLRGEFPREELDKRLVEADAKDSQELREVLGSHLQEYEMMQGHFEEAGLLDRPFEPPVGGAPPTRE